MSVGTDHETAAFAVNTLRTWWNTRGRHAYPDADQLLITADSGGSNGNRRRTWKTELAALAAETGLAINIACLPDHHELPRQATDQATKPSSN